MPSSNIRTTDETRMVSDRYRGVRRASSTRAPLFGAALSAAFSAAFGA
jgi:hypothetical protein